MSNNLWKNVKTLVRSILSLVFEIEQDNGYLEKLEELARLRCICLCIILLYIDNKAEGNLMDIAEMYISQKATILRTKFGLELSEESKILSKNYIFDYIGSLNSERTCIIFTIHLIWCIQNGS